MRYVKLYIYQWHNYNHFWQPHNDHIWHLQSKKKVFWKAPAVSFHRESYSKLGVPAWHSLRTLWQQLISWDRRREAEHGGHQNASKVLWAVSTMPLTQGCLFHDYCHKRHWERSRALNEPNPTWHLPSHGHWLSHAGKSKWPFRKNPGGTQYFLWIIHSLLSSSLLFPLLWNNGDVNFEGVKYYRVKLLAREAQLQSENYEQFFLKLQMKEK